MTRSWPRSLEDSLAWPCLAAARGLRRRPSVDLTSRARCGRGPERYLCEWRLKPPSGRDSYQDVIRLGIGDGSRPDGGSLGNPRFRSPRPRSRRPSHSTPTLASAATAAPMTRPPISPGIPVHRSTTSANTSRKIGGMTANAHHRCQGRDACASVMTPSAYLRHRPDNVRRDCGSTR